MELGFKEIIEITLAIVVIGGIGLILYKVFTGQFFALFKGLGGNLILALR